MNKGLMWLIIAALPAIAVAGVHKHVKHSHWTSKYDVHFKKYTKHYFGPHFDWHWFKAQAIAESALNPEAVSPVGARGIMQIMPDTFGDIKRSNPMVTHIADPKWNIAAGIYYDRQLYREWKKRKKVRVQDRLYFTFASYNAGLGNVLKAYKRATARYGEVEDWERVEPHTPKETRLYVKRINSLMQTSN